MAKHGRLNIYHIPNNSLKGNTFILQCKEGAAKIYFIPFINVR